MTQRRWWHTGSSMALGLTLLLSACAGGGDADQIARDACSLLEELSALDFFDEDDAQRFEELQPRFDDIDRQIEEAGLSDADVEAAVRERCPDVYELDDQ